jgi:hypothetical protein
VVMGALEVTALSAVAGSRTVSLMGFVDWKSCCCIRNVIQSCYHLCGGFNCNDISGGR